MIPKLATYILTCQDDTDILINAVKSAMSLGPVFLFDTGQGARYQHRLDGLESVYAFYRNCKAQGWPVYYTDQVQWLDSAVDYAHARNTAGKWLANTYEWVVMLDSDEMLSKEFVHDLPALLHLLDSTDNEVVTIAPEWLTLWPDAEHYAVNYSGSLAHGRVYRPKKITWQGPIHEHQHYDGQRMEWPRKILHFRQLFTKRSQRQNGHGGDAWPRINEAVRPVSELPGVSWLAFNWSLDDQPELL